MSYLLKKTLVSALRPLATLSHNLDSVGRLRANAKLNSALGGKVHLSVVTIGEGAVIGANAVVTKNIPAGSVAVSMPAQVIKS
ncbi:MAG: hypothetical protein WCK96_16835 [Methylococcales bacterium]